jgi:hypothetical protein
MDESMIMTLVIVAVVGLVTLASLAFAGYIMWKVFSKMGEASRLKQIGIPGTAQVLSLSDTGTTINDNPMVALSLQVQSPHHGSYQVQTTSIISRLVIPRVQPGGTVPVKIDPTNPQKVVLDL